MTERVKFFVSKGRHVGDPLSILFPWWLEPLRAAGYDLAKVPETRFRHIRDALTLAHIELAPARPVEWRRELGDSPPTLNPANHAQRGVHAATHPFGCLARK